MGDRLSRLLLGSMALPEAGGLVAMAIPLLAVLCAMAVGGVIIALAGVNPFLAYSALFQAALGKVTSIGVTITKATPLLLAGVGVAFAFRAGLLNIGGEGQIYIGALAATVTAIWGTGLPFLVHLPLTLLAGFIGGAFWGAIPGFLRARLGLNEIITTIMMNYVGFWMVSYLVHGPLIDPDQYGYPWTVEVPTSSQLPIIFKTARINLGIVVALAGALALHLVLWRTTFGYQVRAVGAGALTARFAGINVNRSIVLSMAVAGGMAGLAGTNEVMGVQHRLSDFFSPGYGYDAIAVAFVGQTNPSRVILAALFFGALRSGAEGISRSIAVPASIALVVQGVAVLFVVASGSVRLSRAIAKRRMVHHEFTMNGSSR